MGSGGFSIGRGAIFTDNREVVLPGFQNILLIGLRYVINDVTEFITLAVSRLTTLLTDRFPIAHLVRGLSPRRKPAFVFLGGEGSEVYYK